MFNIKYHIRMLRMSIPDLECQASEELREAINDGATEKEAMRRVSYFGTLIVIKQLINQLFSFNRN